MSNTNSYILLKNHPRWKDTNRSTRTRGIDIWETSCDGDECTNIIAANKYDAVRRKTFFCSTCGYKYRNINNDNTPFLLEKIAKLKEENKVLQQRIDALDLIHA